MLISNIFLDAPFEVFELPDEICDGFPQMYSFLALNLAKNQKVQRDSKKAGNLGKEIHSADIFTGFNTAQDAPVHVQLLCKPFLCIAVLLADLADTRSDRKSVV